MGAADIEGNWPRMRGRIVGFREEITSIGQILPANLRENPDRIALHVYEEGRLRSLTYAELSARAALFATEFGRTVTSARLDAYDIAGPDQGPSDGVINFNDFFRFADDYGKTVANADAVRTALGL